MIDRAAIDSYLHELYGTAEAGYLALFHLPSRLTTWVAATDLATAGATIERLGQTGNVYIGVGVQAQPLGAGQRGSGGTVVALPGFFMDIDLAGGEHKATRLPRTMRQIGDLVRSAIPLTPSLAVFSGGGLHCYWLFHEVWAFESAEERAEAARLNRLLQAKIIRSACDRGWELESTADLARVLRPAGTVNRKRIDAPAPVRIVHQSGQRYGINEFEPYLPADTDAAPGARRLTAVEPHEPSAIWSHVVGSCAYLQHCVKDAATLDEPAWHAAITIVGRCRDGQEIAHRISHDYPTYDEHETDKKFTHALKVDAPLRCETIRYHRGGERWCARCPYWGAISSPIVLGYPRGYIVRSAAQRAPRRQREEAVSA